MPLSDSALSPPGICSETMRMLGVSALRIVDQVVPSVAHVEDASFEERSQKTLQEATSESSFSML